MCHEINRLSEILFTGYVIGSVTALIRAGALWTEPHAGGMNKKEILPI